MSFPYDKRSRSRGQRAVPLEVAQKLADERDRLRAELQKARRERDRMTSDQEAMVRQIESLRERAQEAEAEARSLREEFASRAEESSADEPEKDDQTDVVRRLSRRIDELTKDLERVENRTQRAVEDGRRQERIRLLAGLGEVLDSTERALDMQGAEGPWRQGLEAIHSQLIRFFEAEGAELIGKVGEKMDPHRHEAVGVVDVEGYEKGEIVNVERQGLVLGDGTVVRTARVQVAA